MTIDNLVRIFKGEITSWRDPRILADNPDQEDLIPDEDIIRVLREDSSGTTRTFVSGLAESSEWDIGIFGTWPSSVITNSTYEIYQYF